MSYSEVVNDLQGDEMKAIKRLIENAEAQQKCLHKIKELNIQIDIENQAYNNKMTNMEHICEHIKKYPPFIIVHDDKVYQFSDTYEVNVSDIDYLISSKQ